MRYALRNQAKIKNALGENQLKIIIASLKSYFLSNSEIRDGDIDHSTAPHPTLVVPSVEKSNTVSFYVLAKVYDVYKLAFKECTDGHT